MVAPIAAATAAVALMPPFSLDGVVVLVPVAAAAVVPFCFKGVVARLPAEVVGARLLVLLCLAAVAALLVVGVV